MYPVFLHSWLKIALLGRTGLSTGIASLRFWRPRKEIYLISLCSAPEWFETTFSAKSVNEVMDILREFFPSVMALLELGEIDIEKHLRANDSKNFVYSSPKGTALISVNQLIEPREKYDHCVFVTKCRVR